MPDLPPETVCFLVAHAEGSTSSVAGGWRREAAAEAG